MNSLPAARCDLATEVDKSLASLKWFLWQGNVFRALQVAEAVHPAPATRHRSGMTTPAGGDARPPAPGPRIAHGVVPDDRQQRPGSPVDAERPQPDQARPPPRRRPPGRCSSARFRRVGAAPGPLSSYTTVSRCVFGIFAFACSSTARASSGTPSAGRVDHSVLTALVPSPARAPVPAPMWAGVPVGLVGAGQALWWAAPRYVAVPARYHPSVTFLELCWFVYQRAPTPPGGWYSSLSLSLASGGFLRFRCHRG